MIADRVEALPGYREPKSMVHCGIYPVNNADFEELRGYCRRVAGAVGAPLQLLSRARSRGSAVFAVPWDAFQHRHNVANNEHYMLLNADEATLKKAPGFNQDAWPNFADAKFSAGIDKYYEKFRGTRRTDINVDARDGQGKVEVDANRDRVAVAQPDNKELAGTHVHRASKINGMKVKNASGTELGSVNDLVIDMDSGKVRYAALSYGGFLGLGDKLFAVPWSAFEFQYNPSDKDYHLVLGLDEPTLRKATGFDKDNWPNFADRKISDEIDRHYRRTEKATP